MAFVQKAQFYIQAFEGMLSDDFTLHCLGAFIVSFFSLVVFYCCVEQVKGHSTSQKSVGGITHPPGL